MGVAERYLYVALSRHFRSVGDAGADVGLFDARVVVQDFLAAHSAREQVENQRHPDPVPPNAGLSEAHLRVDRDAGKQLFSGHDDTVTVSLDPAWLRAHSRADSSCKRLEVRTHHFPNPADSGEGVDLTGLDPLRSVARGRAGPRGSVPGDAAARFEVRAAVRVGSNADRAAWSRAGGEEAPDPQRPRSACVRDPPGGFDVAPPDRGRVPAGRPEAGDRDGGGRLDVHGLVTREGTGASSATAAVTRLLEEAGRRV